MSHPKILLRYLCIKSIDDWSDDLIIQPASDRKCTDLCFCDGESLGYHFHFAWRSRSFVRVSSLSHQALGYAWAIMKIVFQGPRPWWVNSSGSSGIGKKKRVKVKDRNEKTKLSNEFPSPTPSDLETFILGKLECFFSLYSFCFLLRFPPQTKLNLLNVFDLHFLPKPHLLKHISSPVSTLTSKELNQNGNRGKVS